MSNIKVQTCLPARQVSKTNVCLLIILVGVIFLFPSTIQAQTVDYQSWQTGATGLQSQNRADKKTGGLGFTIQVQDWPRLYGRGGVKDGSSYTGAAITGPTDIDLGQIKPSTGTSGFVSEQTDWAHNELSFNSTVKLIVSRMSPAVLFNSSANTLTLFSGTLSGNELYNGSNIRSIARTSFPKYAAYPTQSGVTVIPLSTGTTSLSSITNANWIMLWYGTNSHFIDSKEPLSYPVTIPRSYAYQADIPLLLHFQNPPTSIKQSSEGGIELTFNGQAGNITILPLYGRDVLKASNTENWSTGLPQNVIDKANWWSQRLCEYPTTVSESYPDSGNTDTATIQEDITFTNVCGGTVGTKFASIPPMLGISKDALNVQFSGTLIDANYPTEFGPLFGIENTSTYTWSISGLDKYINAKRILKDGQVPQELTQELQTEVDKLFDQNGNPIHFAPWIFIDYFIYPSRGDLYWANPADVLNSVLNSSESAQGSLQIKLIDYAKAVEAKYPAQTTYNIDLFNNSSGSLVDTPRYKYAYYEGSMNWYWDRGTQPDKNCHDCREDTQLKRVPLYNFYAVDKYYENTQEQLPSNIVTSATNTLNQDMQEQDWATMYWFDGYDSFNAHGYYAVINSSKNVASLLGFTRLAKKQGDTTSETLGKSLLVKSMMQRVGLAKYTSYLYARNLVDLPSDPAWQAKNFRAPDFGIIYNYDWTDLQDDPRQVTHINQFGVSLLEHAYFNGARFTEFTSPFLVGFRDMVPEVYRLLEENAKQESETYIHKIETLFPHWYSSFSEANLGGEHNLFHPVNSYQIFMAKALLVKDTPEHLEHYLDTPWLTEGGDLFYIHKLAETIKAYRGWCWSDEPNCEGSGSFTGDLNNDNTVNIQDIIILINEIFTPSGVTGSDINNDGKVDILDVIALINIIFS